MGMDYIFTPTSASTVGGQRMIRVVYLLLFSNSNHLSYSKKHRFLEFSLYGVNPNMLSERLPSVLPFLGSTDISWIYLFNYSNRSQQIYDLALITGFALGAVISNELELHLRFRAPPTFLT